MQQQLQSLMETLSTTEPHYIRCVKPNTVLKPGIFENFNVLNQLRCGVCMWICSTMFILQPWFHVVSWLVWHLHIVMIQGVLEAIRISCAGYPTKRTFDEFIDRFGMLAPELVDRYDCSSCDLSRRYSRGETQVKYANKIYSDFFWRRFNWAQFFFSSDEKAACAAICDRMGLKGYQVAYVNGWIREIKQSYTAYIFCMTSLVTFYIR